MLSTKVLANWWERWGVITVISGLCYLAVTRLIWHAVLEPSFAHLETQEASRNMDRCVAALRREIDDVAGTASDYATWDDCHDFVAGTNPTLIERDFVWAHLDRVMGIQAYAILNIEGKVLASAASPFLHETDASRCLAALPLTALRALVPAGPPPHPPAASGVIENPVAPLLVAVAPIRRNSAEGDAVGHMILARILDGALVSRIAQRAQVPLELRDFATTRPTGSPPVSKDGIILTRLDAMHIRAETAIATLIGESELRLATTLPRPIMARGRHAMRVIESISVIATALIVFLFVRQGQKARQLELRTNQLIGSWHRLDDENRQRLQEFSRRLEAEGKLGRLREQLDAVVRAVPQPLFAKDIEGRYILFNPAFDAFFGVRGEKLIGRTAVECWPSHDARIYHEHDMQLMREGGLQIYEHVLQDAAGRERHVIFNKACFADAGGKLAGLVGTITDVTALKEAETERVRLERQFQEAQKIESLGILAGGIAHDFNNLLVGILGHADLALLKTERTDPVSGDLHAVITASQRAVDLCRQMLAYSGRGRFVIEQLDVNATIREMAELLGISVSKKVTIELDLSPDLPRIEADATQIRQVVMNLITNASEAIGNRPGTIRIGTRHKAADPGAPETEPDAETLPPGVVQIHVTDTGCGMTPETIAKIFDPFFTTKFTGRGLGLAAVLGIIRGHGGTIAVDSIPGQGSTFRLILPAIVAKGTAQEPPAAPSRIQVDPWRGNGTVLLADDESAVRTVTSRMCEHMGFSVLAACDGEDAVRLLKESNGDVACIILDLIMPGMDGLETLTAIRSINPRIPVILSSGYHESEVRRRFGGTGFTAFIQKPYQLDQLREILRATLAQ